MIHNFATTRTIVPAANMGDPDVITYNNHINTKETFAESNTAVAKQNVFVTWGDNIFTMDPPPDQIIRS